MTTQATIAAPPSASTASGGRRHHYVGLLAVALTFVVYGPILYYMVLHWEHVADYSHGFLIAPLSLYFAWERTRN